LSYQPSPISDVPERRVTRLVQAAKQRRLVLYIGAGISMGPPSCGPAGPALADVLRPFVARMLGVDEVEVADLSLEALAERVAVEVPDRLDELRELAAVAFDFRGIEPNFGHEMVALLIRERLVEAITVNWDCRIERAGARAEAVIAGVATLAESLQLGHRLPLYKVHGCATVHRRWPLRKRTSTGLRRELIRGDGRHLRVQFAAHREIVTGRDLILGVVLELDGRPVRCGKAPLRSSAAALTPREREVVALVALGGRRREIAAQLFISEATVKTHLRNAMHKLDVHSQAQLVAVALTQGLIELEPRGRGRVGIVAEPHR
jgi:DNA-binding CsgD family transcriptional regulator